MARARRCELRKGDNKPARCKRIVCIIAWGAAPNLDDQTQGIDVGEVMASAPCALWLGAWLLSRHTIDDVEIAP